MLSLDKYLEVFQGCNIEVDPDGVIVEFNDKTIQAISVVFSATCHPVTVTSYGGMLVAGQNTITGTLTIDEGHADDVRDLMSSQADLAVRWCRDGQPIEVTLAGVRITEQSIAHSRCTNEFIATGIVSSRYSSTNMLIS